MRKKQHDGIIIATEPVQLTPCVVSVDDLQFDPNQPRAREYFETAKNRKRIAALGTDIARRGQLTPVIIRPKTGNKATLLDGECRFRGAKQNGVKKLMALICTAKTERGLLDASLASNCKRDDLSLGEKSVFIEHYFKQICKDPHFAGVPRKKLWLAVCKHIAKITGFSTTHWQDAWIIVESKTWCKDVGVRIKRLVQKNKIPGYGLSEIQKASENPGVRKGLALGHLESLKREEAKARETIRKDPTKTPASPKSELGANYPRGLKRLIEKVEKQPTTDAQKTEAIVEIIKDVVLNSDDKAPAVPTKEQKEAVKLQQQAAAAKKAKEIAQAQATVRAQAAAKAAEAAKTAKAEEKVRKAREAQQTAQAAAVARKTAEAKAEAEAEAATKAEAATRVATAKIDAEEALRARSRRDAYCAIVDTWYDAMTPWSVTGMNEEDHNAVSSRLHSLHELWLSKWQAKYGSKSPSKKHTQPLEP